MISPDPCQVPLFQRTRRGWCHEIVWQNMKEGEGNNRKRYCERLHYLNCFDVSLMIYIANQVDTTHLFSEITEMKTMKLD